VIILGVSIISGLHVTPAKAQTFQYNVGISSFPWNNINDGTSTWHSVLDDVIDMMNEEGLDIYRMSISTGKSASAYVRYFFENCNHKLIVDFYHMYPPGTTTNSEWSTIQTEALALLSEFSNYQDRLYVELTNERYDSDFRSRIQTIVTAIRNAGYTANILADVHTSYRYSNLLADMRNINDPLDKFYTGQHFYFNQWTLSQAESFMQVGLNAGLKMINTEVGADANEVAYFDQNEVNALNNFLAWCADRGIGNTV
jgi:hypothetical protein